MTTYIFKGYKEAPRVSEVKKVTHPFVMKDAGYIDIPGIGKCLARERTGGKDTKKFEVWTVGRNYTMDATHDGIKEKMRIVRPEEEAELARIAAEIARLQELRKEVLKKAWNKAHVVTVKHLLAIAGGLNDHLS